MERGRPQMAAFVQANVGSIPRGDVASKTNEKSHADRAMALIATVRLLALEKRKPQPRGSVGLGPTFRSVTRREAWADPCVLWVQMCAAANKKLDILIGMEPAQAALCRWE
jgi:hypothetical protein